MYVDNAIRRLLLACYYGYAFSGYAGIGECVCCKKSRSQRYNSEKLPSSLTSIQLPFW